jgi:hypothetical protein
MGKAELQSVTPLSDRPAIENALAHETNFLEFMLDTPVPGPGVSTFSTRSVLIPLLHQVNRRPPFVASVYIEFY